MDGSGSNKLKMKKYNFNLDLTKKNVSIEVLTSIFPVAVILHAAYHFIEEAKVITDQSKNQNKDKIIITFILEKDHIKESDLEELAYEFNLQLISSFLEEVESKRHAGLRETLMKAAMSPQQMRPRTQSTPPRQPSSPQNNQKRDKQ